MVNEDEFDVNDVELCRSRSMLSIKVEGKGR